MTRSIFFWGVLLALGAVACVTDPEDSGQNGDVFVSVTITPTVVKRGDKFVARVLRKNLGSTRVNQESGWGCPAEFTVYRGNVYQGPAFPEVWSSCLPIGTPYPLAPHDSQVMNIPVTALGAPGEYEFRVLWYLSSPGVPNLKAKFTIR